MSTSFVANSRAHNLQIVSPLSIVLTAIIYSAVVVITFGIIALNPVNVWYTSYIPASIALTIAFAAFTTFFLFNGIFIATEKIRFKEVFKFKRIPFLSTKWLADFMTTAEGLPGLVFGFLVWVIMGVFVILFYYLIGSVALLLAFIIGYIIYLVFFKVLKSLFAFTTKCKGSFFLSIQYAIIYTVLYNLFLYAIIAIGLWLINL